VPTARSDSGAFGWLDGKATLLGVLLVLAALSYLDRQIITLLVDPIKADLGVTDTQIGFAQGIGFVLFYAIAGIPLGMMADRYSRRLIIFGGIVVWSLATAACGLASSFEELLIARLMVGAGDAALLPAAYSLIADSFERGRLATAMATFSLGSIAGGAISLAIGGALAGLAGDLAGGNLPFFGERAQWQVVFLIVGLGGLPFSLLVFLIREPPRVRPGQSAHAAPQQGFRAAFRANRRFYLLHFAAFSVMAMPAAATAAWTPTYLQRHFELPVATVGLILAAKSLLTGTIGMLGSSMLADRLFRKGYSDAHLRIYIVLSAHRRDCDHGLHDAVARPVRNRAGDPRVGDAVHRGRGRRIAAWHTCAPPRHYGRDLPRRLQSRRVRRGADPDGPAIRSPVRA